MRTNSLVAVLCTIARTSVKDLKDPSLVASFIRSAGLVFDARGLYGDDNRFMNHNEEGLWQIPDQLAHCLVALADYNIETILDVGTWSGWTISLITAYLMRFNPTISAVTIDVGNGFSELARVQRLLPITFRVTDTSSYSAQPFDLVIIDGDHSYDAAKRDYENVGKNAKICMFHDINDKFVRDYAGNEGGVPRLWQEITKSWTGRPARTYIQHSSGEQVMGIGLLLRTTSRQ